MYVWFFVSLFGFIAVILPYFLSLEHRKLEEKYGKEKGNRFRMGLLPFLVRNMVLSSKQIYYSTFSGSFYSTSSC